MEYLYNNINIRVTNNSRKQKEGKRRKMGFGKILKCNSCESEFELYLGESRDNEVETILFCKVCGAFGNKSELVGETLECCGKPLEEIKDFGELDKKIKKFRCPDCSERDIVDTEDLFSWE